MTIKMMISTSKMSISGTTLGVDNAPWPSPPTSIPIAILLWAQGQASPQAVGPRRVGSGAGSNNQQTNGKKHCNSNDQEQVIEQAGPQSAGGRGVGILFSIFWVSSPS